MTIVRKYRSIVTDFTNPAPGLYQVKFSPLDGKYKFLPGQFLHLALDEYNPSLPWPESRCFSIQNSPAVDFIKITFSVKGSFTQRMAKELYEGKEVWLKLPYGDIFNRGNFKENCVFISGGTGITPFLSLFTHKSFIEYINPHIYIGFRKKEYNIYLDELTLMGKQAGICVDNCNYKRKAIIRIYYENNDDKLEINKIFKESKLNSTYFISGPPGMNESFKNFLLGKHVLINKIITDDWE